MSEQPLQSELAAHAGNLVRSEINKDADYDLEDWILERLQLRPGARVLDVGAGNGKQSKRFSAVVGTTGEVVAADIFSQVTGLRAAAEAALGALGNVTLLDHDANQPFPLADRSFDAVNSSYSIYYIRDAERLLRDIHRMLAPGGRAFIVGPAWDNSREFYDLHCEIAGAELPAAFADHLYRINDDIVPTASRIFPRVDISPFVNRVYFRGAEGLDKLASYYRSSMLVEEAATSPAAKDALVAKFVERARTRMQGDTYYMFKRALGLTCWLEPRS